VYLDADRLTAVVAHERGHLDQRHHDLVWLTRLGAVIHPVLAPILRHVKCAADEAAATALGDRRWLAEALGMAALHKSGASRRVGPLRFGSRLGHVPRRVVALSGECVYDLQELLRLAVAA
jgi:Zn-dependent protease with chaperone function